MVPGRAPRHRNTHKGTLCLRPAAAAVRYGRRWRRALQTVAGSAMHYLSEEHILIFLVQVGLLLGLSRLAGELFRRWGQPAITAEILVGIFLGPTVFGRLAPDLHGALFPLDQTQQTMLDTLAWLGILLFLLRSGLDTNLATAWRQRTQALVVSFSDLIIPMVVAFVPCLFLPARYLGEGASLVAFCLFIATIMTISALPVTARLLQDLRVYRTDMGLLIMSALTINDVAGWVVFALILSFYTGSAAGVGSVLTILVGTLAFAAACLLLGPRLFDRVLARMKRLNVPEPGGSLTVVCLVGLLCGAATTAIGIHALFGFFIAGILAGESALLSERTRHVFSQLVHAILVPLFFASIGLKIDFLGSFDPLLAVFILTIGVAGRYVGAYVGSRAVRQSPVHSRFIGLAHIPGGEMQIVIGMLALDYAVISEAVYVAIVIGAIGSSVLAGPVMKRVLHALQECDFLAYLPFDHVLLPLPGASRDEAIAELCRAAADHVTDTPPPDLAAAVLDRERQMSTALDEGVAVPHARVAGLAQPLVLLGRSDAGVEWHAPDGKPVRIIFLILTPEDDAESQLQILRGIATAVSRPEVRRDLLTAQTAPDMLAALRQAGTAGNA